MKRLSTYPVIITTLMLQGCVAAVVGSAAVATKSAIDPRSIGTQVDDETLELRVTNMLSKDEKIKKNAHIIVTVYQGKILLTGQSPDSALAQRAKQIAIGVNGATKVYNQVRIDEKVSLSTALSDTWITTKVRLQLLNSDQVTASNVRVTTENGEVFLMGLVTPSEAKAAAYIASCIIGVRHVTTSFIISK